MLHPPQNPFRRALNIAWAVMTTTVWISIFVASFLGFLNFPLGMAGVILVGYIAFHAVRVLRRT